MRFSLWLYPYGRWGGIEAMGDATAKAEELGFDNVSVSDHVICPAGPDAAGVTPVWYDWSVLSAYLALRTTRIRILTSLVIPYRPVLSVAKQISTIDALSGGRFILAAAVGWLKPEFEMLGVSHRQRGAITDEYLDAMKLLWTEESPSFDGEFIQFSDITFDPKCVQSPHVPIWIAGGTAPGVQRRLVRVGDGWMPMGGDPGTELRDTIHMVRHEVGEVGRDPESMTFRYTIGIGKAEAALTNISRSISVDVPTTVDLGESPEQVAEEISRFEGFGFNELAINFAGDSGPQVMEQLQWFGEEVIPILPTDHSRL